jgi:hypothetical protein
VGILTNLPTEEIRMSNEQRAPTDLFSTIDALTKRDGQVTTANNRLTGIELVIARVGDIVTCKDDSEAA